MLYERCVIYGILLCVCCVCVCVCVVVCFLQAEDGIRDLVRSRGLGDVYKRQLQHRQHRRGLERRAVIAVQHGLGRHRVNALGQRRALDQMLSLIHI